MAKSTSEKNIAGTGEWKMGTERQKSRRVTNPCFAT
jgi:hypothetical protein